MREKCEAGARASSRPTTQSRTIRAAITRTIAISAECSAPSTASGTGRSATVLICNCRSGGTDSGRKRFAFSYWSRLSDLLDALRATRSVARGKPAKRASPGSVQSPIGGDTQKAPRSGASVEPDAPRQCSSAIAAVAAPTPVENASRFLTGAAYRTCLTRSEQREALRAASRRSVLRRDRFRVR